MTGVELPEQFREFAASVERDGAMTYAAICRQVADDPGLLALMGEAPPDQRRPNLLLAAVHYLLLGGTDHELARYYDTVALAFGRPFAPPAADVGPVFSRFCLEHRPALLDLLATRRTQTNEVGRCAALLPALCAITAPDTNGLPMALLDLGTSAGLNLLFDHFHYLYRQRSDGTIEEAGDPTSGVTLECAVRGELADLPPFDHPPALVARAGLDASPVDPTTEDGGRWLLACAWPDQVERFERLRAAIDVARVTLPRPTLHPGDMVDDLAAVAATVAPGHPLVVFHSWVAAYLTEDRQRELVDAVAALAADRPVHYLYAEAFAETPGLPTPPSPEPGPTSDLATALVYLHFPVAGRPSSPIRLADLHPHGRWLRWWPPRRPEARDVTPSGRV
ncbi:MAG TPA: DUF2332 domain-containing protein [Acidimicrobiales bacterium]